MRKLIFDVNGTLTPPNGAIDVKFKDYLVRMSKAHDIYLVTEGDLVEIRKQVTNELFSRVTSYQFKDKTAILQYCNLSNDRIYFFGDSIYPEGNDYTLAKALAPFTNRVYSVENWKDTQLLLKEMIDI